MNKTITIEYSSNNSGGDWWLEDKDWKNLEKNGWKVEWGGLDFCKKCKDSKTTKGCQGHIRFKRWQDMKTKDRFLGALARGATKKFKSIDDAVKEFEVITGQDAEDEGCLCCGQPHNFNERNY